jgi:hypothetical protein
MWPNIDCLIMYLEKCIKYRPNTWISNSISSKDQRVVSTPFRIFFDMSITSTKFMAFHWIQWIRIWWLARSSRANLRFNWFFLRHLLSLVWLLHNWKLTLMRSFWRQRARTCIYLHFYFLLSFLFLFCSFFSARWILYSIVVLHIDQSCLKFI